MTTYEQNIELIANKGKELRNYAQGIMEEMSAEIADKVVLDNIVDDELAQHPVWANQKKEHVVELLSNELRNDLKIVRPTNMEVVLYGDKLFSLADKGYVYGPSVQYEKLLREAASQNVWQLLADVQGTTPPNAVGSLDFKDGYVEEPQSYLNVVEKVMSVENVSEDEVNDYTLAFLNFAIETVDGIKQRLSEKSDVPEERKLIIAGVKANLARIVEQQSFYELNDGDLEIVAKMKYAEEDFFDDAQDVLDDVIGAMDNLEEFVVDISDLVSDYIGDAYDAYEYEGGERQAYEVEDSLANQLYIEIESRLEGLAVALNLDINNDVSSIRVGYSYMLEYTEGANDVEETLDFFQLHTLQEVVESRSIKDYLDEHLDRDLVIANNYDEEEIEEYIANVNEARQLLHDDHAEIMSYISLHDDGGREFEKNIDDIVRISADEAGTLVAQADDEY